MKKNIIIAAVAVVSALFVTVSCTKQEVSGSQTSGEGRSFTAVIEQDFTKTTLTDDLKVYWQNGDRISINGYEYTATAKIPATKALFSPVGDEAPKSVEYQAFFPADLINGFPQTQIYREGSIDTPMYARSETEELSFKNLCGVLHFAIKGNERVRSITVKSANEEEHLWGTFAVPYPETGEIELYAGGDDTVVLDCGENGVQLDPAVPADFYISLPPRTYSTGMEITVTGTDPEKLNVTKTTVMDITIARNTVYDLEWNFEPTVNETLAKFFKDMAKDQAALAAATDEAVGVVAQQNFFLPEIHTWENAHSAIKAIDKGLNRLWDEELTEVQKKQKEVELHFFRALLYFELFRTYGYALYKGDEYQSPCPSGSIFTEIMDGAKKALDCLPQSYDETDRIITLDEGVEVTRPTQWAAKALMARACLYAASPLFNKILAPSEASQYSEAVLKGGQFDLEPNYPDLWGIKAFDNKELIFGVRLASNDAYTGIKPTERLMKTFDSGDIRSQFTIEKTKANVMPIFRYADILLIYVESKLVVGDTAYANEWLNKLRQRAGLSDVEATMDLIEKERMTELAFEGHRFWDVRRWKAGKNFANIDGIERQWDEKYNFYPVPQE